MNAQLYDNEVEQSVLGEMMKMDVFRFKEYRDKVSANCFYSDFNRQVYSVMLAINDRGEEATLPSIAEEWRKSTQTPPLYQLAELNSHFIVDDTLLTQYVGILNRYSKRRMLWLLGQELTAKGLTTEGDIDEIILSAKDELDKIIDQDFSESVTLTDALTTLGKRIDNNFNGKKNEDITYTGFPSIDANGGFESGSLIVIGAVASMGKTALADSFAHNIIRQQHKVVFFSLEMTLTRIGSRLLASATGIEANKLYNDKLEDDELIKVDKTIGDMNAYSDCLLFPKKAKFTLSAICSSIRYHHAHFGIKGAIIDYVQMIKSEGGEQSREQFIGTCSHNLQELAKELNIWIVLLSQINRGTNSTNPIPTQDNLRDSGQIVEAADNIYLVYRPEKYNKSEGKDYAYPPPYENVDTNGTAMIITSKSRNGRVGSFICGFDDTTTTFFPLESVPVKGEHTDTKNQMSNEIKLPF